MKNERAILHSDLNSFYASVEIMLNPALRDKAIAVCGSTEDRHGIVLAKSEKAKKAGIKTGMVNWEAKQKCPDLLMVPPQYDQYLKYSKLTREIYQRFTDQVEPYGMDECWLDVTGSKGVCGNDLSIAEEIRRTTREELGLTVSIGVSYNKIFAKLGSDMKKPDAITVIRRDDYQEKVWPLPVSDLFYVGRATDKKLSRYGIRSIGELAKAPRDFLRSTLGKNGEMLWFFANGEDQSRVMKNDFYSPVKSIGHGTTCTSDLENNDEVWKVMLHLTQDISHRLRVHDMKANGVQITVKDKDLSYRQYQMQLPMATQSPMEIALAAKYLFEIHYDWHTHVRAVTVRAINLEPKFMPQQLMLFDDAARRARMEKLDDTIETIRSRYGKWSIYSASLLDSIKTPGVSSHEVIMPGIMYA
ncbi:MAG: DNA polymerase IV [Eubacteriaceae bacterium]|nr:DNA polymerase IV [Eubacteriaceae bacterium]